MASNSFEKISEGYNTEELGTFLRENGTSDDVVSMFVENRVDGRAFLLLTDDDLKQLVTLIGERARFRRLLNACKVNNELEQGASIEVGSVGKNTLQEKTLNVQKPHQPSLSCPWHKAFVIPDKNSFSRTVQSAIETGVVCSRARREICQTIRTLMLQHTTRPSKEEYSEVCLKLIQKFPALNDGGTSGSGSWKLSLRNGFKNFRRDHGDKENVAQQREGASQSGPASKRRKTIDIPDTITDEEYRETILQMKGEYAKKRGKNHSLIKQLMESTRGRRHQWITNEGPMTSQILEDFPLLSSAKSVGLLNFNFNNPLQLRREFRAVSGWSGRATSLVTDWSTWVDKIIRFSRIEAATRIGIRKVLEEYDREKDVPIPADRSNYLVLTLLLRLLYPKGLSKNTVFIKTFECDVALEMEISKIEQTAPYIVSTGKPGEESAQYFVACEKSIFCESKTLLDSVADLLAVYYVCHIQYTGGMNAIMRFLQCTVFELSDHQPLPGPTSKLINNLKKV